MYWWERFQDDKGFTAQVVASCELASQLACERRLIHFGLRFLLLGMIDNEESIAARVLKEGGIDLEYLRSLLKALPYSSDVGNPPERAMDSMFVSSVLSHARNKSSSDRCSCDTGHLLDDMIQAAITHNATIGGQSEAGAIYHVLWQASSVNLAELLQPIKELRNLFPED